MFVHIKRHDFRENVIEYEMCVLFSLQLLFETFLILSRIQWDIIINVQRSSLKRSFYFYQTLMKVEFSQQIFKKYSNIKFYEIPSSGRPVVGRMDVQTDMKLLVFFFFFFCNYLIAPKSEVHDVVRKIVTCEAACYCSFWELSHISFKNLEDLITQITFPFGLYTDCGRSSLTSKEWCNLQVYRCTMLGRMFEL